MAEVKPLTTLEDYRQALYAAHGELARMREKYRLVVEASNNTINSLRETIDNSNRAQAQAEAK